MTERWSVENYSRECTRFQWRVVGLGAAAILAMLGCFGLVLPFRNQIKAMLVDQFGLPTAEIVLGLTPLPAVVVFFVGLFWLQRKCGRIKELNCPNCKKFIAGMRFMVVATKCCPYCGAKILHDVI